MKAPDLAYLRAESIEQAIDALAAHGDEAAILAGGQSLMPMLNLRVAGASVLVDINRIPGLDAIRDAGDHVAIGALARYAALESSAPVREHLPLVAAALPHVAHEAIRNRGTIGGSLALADPAAEIPACCLALGATVVLAGPGGRREVGIEDWFTGLYETARGPGEIIVEVRIPKAARDTQVRFEELTRRRGDFAIAGIAVTARTGDGALRAPRIALLGVADRPVLARTLMDLVEGRPPAAIDPRQLAEAIAADVDPAQDPAYPPDYRRRAAAVLARRTLATMGAAP